MVSKTHTMNVWKLGGKENSQISLSLTTLSTCKKEWKIWMNVCLYDDDLKVISNEKNKDKNIMMIQKWYSTNKSKS